MVVVGVSGVHVQRTHSAAEFDLLLERHDLVTDRNHPSFGDEHLELVDPRLVEIEQPDARQLRAEMMVEIEASCCSQQRHVGPFRASVRDAVHLRIGCGTRQCHRWHYRVPEMDLSTLDSPHTDARVDALIDDPKGLVRLKVLRAARRLMAERGLAVSMDDIAEMSGLGRRTLFRHFQGREEIITAALSSALDWYDGRVADMVRSDLTLDEWLKAITSTLHRIHLDSGRGLWELTASYDDELGAELRAINARRRNERRATTNAIAVEAWRRADGVGACPETVIDACALTMSSFATHSMLLDFGRSADAVAASSAALLGTLLRHEAANSRAALSAGSATSSRARRTRKVGTTATRPAPKGKAARARSATGTR